MTNRRVVITGMGGITALGSSWAEIKPALLAHKNAVKYMPEYEKYKGLNSRLAAPVENFLLPEHYTRKKIRSMGRVRNIESVGRILIDRGQRVKKNNFSSFLCSD